MNDSSEKVAQAGRGCAASAFDELRKQRNLGPLALRSPPIFLVSGRCLRHERLLRKRGTRWHPKVSTQVFRRCFSRLCRLMCGRLKTSRTSGGIAAKNRFEKLDPGG